jgi:Protein of unknown function (DUF3667)
MSEPHASQAPTRAALTHHAVGHAACRNCEAPLAGPYCAQCGQHAHESARELSAVLHNAWHDLTHLDGRLWPTLYFLLLRPGRLTVDYFQEKRARYLPPVRLYLVLSLAFFTVNALQAPPAGSVRAAAEAHQPAPAQSGTPAEGAAEPDDFRITIEEACEHIDIAGVGWLTSRARAACERARHMPAEEFLVALAHNVPKMMFVFLPLMAAVMCLLYWRPRRYYVEHLVFLLHNHSALYLAFLLLDLCAALGRLWSPFGTLTVLLGIATAIYVPTYPYRAQRRYYGQGRLLTLAKFTVLTLAYLLCLVLTLAGTAAVTALGH